jgi:hypothetical protein
MNPRTMLDRFLGGRRWWLRADEPPPPPILLRGDSERRPVPHGPTKAPFSRNARRLRNRAAHRSFMRNQKR